MEQKEKFMKEAIRQAKKAEKIDEVPIGCIIVYQNKIISRGYNRRNIDKNTLAHAARRLYHVCDSGTLSNVCRRHRPGTH